MTEYTKILPLIKAISQRISQVVVRGHIALTVANGADESSVLDAVNKSLVGILMPGTLTSSTFSIHGSVNGSDFYPITDGAGNNLTGISFTADTFLSIDPIFTRPFRYYKIITASNEGAEREFKTITKIIN